MVDRLTVRSDWPVLELVCGSCQQMFVRFPVAPEGAVAACAAGPEVGVVCTFQSLLL